MFKGRKVLQYTIMVMVAVFFIKTIGIVLAYNGVIPNFTDNDYSYNFDSDHNKDNYLFKFGTKNIHDLDFDNYKYSPKKEFNFTSDMKDCSSIELNATVGEIIFNDSKDNKFHAKVSVTLKSNTLKSVPSDYITFSDGNVINIHERNLDSSKNKNIHSTFYISIPSNYKNKVDVSSDVGDIKGKINGSDLVVKSDVGAINLSNSNSESIDLQSDVGAIKLDLSNSKFKNVKCNSDVGAVKLTGVKPENLNLDLSVDIGDIRLNGEYGNIIKQPNDSFGSKHVKKTIGNGEKNITLSANTGDVSISN